jgi:hypothetical protein
MPYSTRLYNFDSGLYGLRDLSQTNRNDLVRVFNEIQRQLQTSTTLTKFEIIIQGGESLVTNPPGFEQRGSLANARSETIKQFIQQEYPDIYNSPKVGPNRIKISPSIIGITEYKPGVDDKNAEKYKKEQFVDINFQEQLRPPRLPNICDRRYGQSITSKASTIPQTGLILRETYNLPRGIRTFEISFISFGYPDAIEVEILNEDRQITKKGFVPLFVSEDLPDEKFKNNIELMYTFYRNNPLSINTLFQYVPLLTFSNREEMIRKLTEYYPRNQRVYTNEAFANGRWYSNLPIFLSKETQPTTLPSNIISPSTNLVSYSNSNQYQRTLSFEVDENDYYVVIKVYGYRNQTEFDFSTRCS